MVPLLLVDGSVAEFPSAVEVVRRADALVLVDRDQNSIGEVEKTEVHGYTCKLAIAEAMKKDRPTRALELLGQRS